MSRRQRREVNRLDPGRRAVDAARHALEDQACGDAFREMLSRFLASDPRLNITPALGVLAAFANGVTLVSEAAALAVAMPRTYRAGDSAYAYFKGLGKRQRCVKMNEIGWIAARLLDGMAFTPTDAIKVFVDWLDQQDLQAFRVTNSNRMAQLAAVERGARAFWSHHLPQLLLSDATGALTLRPLRPEALARWISGQPLSKASPTNPSVNVGAASMLMSADAVEVGSVLQLIVEIMTSGDGTQLDALRGQQLQLLEPLLDEVEGDILSAMLLTVASGICERGTIKESRPSHSISARYTRELERMLVAEPDLAASVLRLTPPERRQAYETLAKHARSASDGRAALTTADMHWCEATGCDPVLPLSSSTAELPHGPTKFLSPLERHRVRALSTGLAPTDDLEVVVRAKSTMAYEQPMRPGDSRDARFEDLEIGPRRAVLNLRRRHNLKGPKRAGTEGPIEFTDPETLAALKALKLHIERWGASDGRPLWGRDLLESRRLHDRACALIDQACKHVSGDPFESFYSLRHGQLTGAVDAAMQLNDPGQAQAALKRASQAAKHARVETTLQDYFRLGAEHAHRHVRAGIGSLLTRDGACAWSGLGQSALDKRVSRSEAPLADVLWSAMAEAAPLSLFRAIAEDHPCAPSSRRLGPASIRLADVLGSATLTQISIEEGTLLPASTAALLAQTNDWERLLLDARIQYGRQWAQASRRAAMRQAKLRPIAVRLEKFANSTAVREATALWRETARNGYIDVSDAPRLSSWTRFLLSSGVPATRLVLRVDPTMQSKTEFLSALFSSITGFLPAIDEVPSGKGRPIAYIVISSVSQAPGVPLPSAAVSMAGFNGLMLAACLREDLARQHDGAAQ